MRKVLALVAGTTLLFGSCGSVASSTDSAPTPATSAAATATAPADQSLDCESDQFVGATIDVFAPRNAAEARANGWPTTARGAAESTLTSPAFRGSLVDVSLTTGSKQDEMAITRFAAVTSDGRTVATIDAQELLEGFWATTSIEYCP